MSDLTQAPVQGHPAWDGSQWVGPLASIRDQAARRFEEMGWPSTRMEAWKYTSLKSVREVAWATVSPVAAADVDARVDARRLPEAWAELVFVNGQWDAERSRMPDAVPEGVRLSALSADLSEEDVDLGGLAPWRDQALVAFNTAWLLDGLRLEVAAGVQVPGVVHVIHATTGADVASNVRQIVRLNRGAGASIVESWLEGSERSLASAVVEQDVGPGARLDHVLDAPIGESSHLLRAAYVRVDRDARWHSVNAWTGSGLVRAEHHLTLAGEGAEASLDAVVALQGRAHVDQHNVFTHAAPHGTSLMRSKSLAAGRSRVVFDGTVVVDPGAQKTDSRQDSRNLLLSERAEIDVKPRLEIYADDVACAHGATVGRLDETARTYLRSRGIPDVVARQMLMEAFVADRLEAVADEGLRAWLSESVMGRLGEVLNSAPGGAS